jgi:polyphosphate kinase 2 (PPK2 family)
VNSEDFAHYLETTQSIHKPWLLVQLRLMKLNERRSQLSAAEYEQELADIQADLIKLGDWWQGREREMFG